MINVCYCGNLGIFKGILMSCLSMAEFASEPLSVTLCTGDFTELDPRFQPLGEKERAFLEATIQGKNPANRVSLLDLSKPFKETLLASPNAKSSYTPYTMLRLFLDKEASLPDKLLYLDADTVVMGDIVPLYAHELGNKSAGMVIDAYGRFFFGPHYCNAGVMLLNLSKIRADGSFEKALSLLKRKHYFFPDQDVLNKVFRGQKLYLPREDNEQKRLRKTTLIRHYCNQPRIFPTIHALIAKPWDIERIHEVYHLSAHDALYREVNDDWREYSK